MLASGAAKRYGQVAFSLPDIVRDQVHQQIGDSLNELDGLREGLNILGDLRMASGQVPELRDVVRVGQEADVEDQVAILWDAVAISKAGAGDQHRAGALAALEAVDNVGFQLV